MHLCPRKGFVKRIVTCLRRHLDHNAPQDYQPLRPSSVGELEEEPPTARRKPRTMVRRTTQLPPRHLKPTVPRPAAAVKSQECPPLPPKPRKSNGVYEGEKRAALDWEKSSTTVAPVSSSETDLDVSLEDDVFAV